MYLPQLLENGRRSLWKTQRYYEHLELPMLPRLMVVEPTCSSSTLLEPSERRPLESLSHHIRYPEVQHQDTARRLADHKPGIVWTMLAVRRNKRLPRRHHEEVQALGVSAVAGLPLLLG